MRYIYILLIALFIAIVGLFVIYNSDSVEIAFLQWDVRLPLALLVVLAYILGMLTGGFLWAGLRRWIRGARARPR